MAAGKLTRVAVNPDAVTWVGNLRSGWIPSLTFPPEPSPLEGIVKDFLNRPFCFQRAEADVSGGRWVVDAAHSDGHDDPGYSGEGGNGAHCRG